MVYLDFLQVSARHKAYAAVIFFSSPVTGPTLSESKDVQIDKNICPNCGQPKMGVIGESNMRMCVNCKTLAWEDNNGKNGMASSRKAVTGNASELNREDEIVATSAKRAESHEQRRQS